MGDLTIEALHYAMDGLNTRQNVIANNVANSQTPGFIASTVSFESGLAAALSSGQPSVQLSPAIAPSTDPVGSNGNNVDLGAQITQDQQTELQYQSVVDALTQKFRVLRSAMG